MMKMILTIKTSQRCAEHSILTQHPVRECCVKAHLEVRKQGLGLQSLCFCSNIFRVRHVQK